MQIAEEFGAVDLPMRSLSLLTLGVKGAQLGDHEQQLLSFRRCTSTPR
jgi:hypothetical protein